MKNKYIHEMMVISNKNLNSKYFLLTLKAPDTLPPILPGQFAQVEIKDAKNTFLRRPLSIHDVNYKNNTIKLLVQIIGEGTRKLSEIKDNDKLSLIYPLGNSFSIPENEDILIVGGGCGIAPLLYTAKVLSEKKNRITTLIGGASAVDILEADEYKKYSNVLITTMDASSGEKGLVTQHSVFSSENFAYQAIYTCGPAPMMKALARIAKEKNIRCEVSLENLMACGIGACLCCVVDTIEGHKCTCTEGPVFNYKELKGWN